jgi:hypothetical protein
VSFFKVFFFLGGGEVSLQMVFVPSLSSVQS